MIDRRAEVETRAMLLHSVRHPMGYAHTCGECRQIAAGKVQRDLRWWRLILTLVVVGALVAVFGWWPY